jgi:putative endonuclease
MGQMTWFLYVIQTEDDTYYTGISTDVDRRYKEHAAQGSKAARYLVMHRPIALVFCYEIGERSNAMKVELAFKRLPRRRKIIGNHAAFLGWISKSREAQSQ